jgi:hypothetical protein
LAAACTLAIHIKGIQRALPGEIERDVVRAFEAVKHAVLHGHIVDLQRDGGRRGGQRKGCPDLGCAFAAQAGEHELCSAIALRRSQEQAVPIGK